MEYCQSQVCQSQCQSQVDHILFAHAWSRCDTTLTAYRKGKLSI